MPQFKAQCVFPSGNGKQLIDQDIFSTISTTTTSTTANSGNPCIICPNGVTADEGESWIPWSNGNRTCAQLVQDALTTESGTNDCGMKEINEMIACCPPTSVANPCTICPDGITAAGGDAHVPTIWPVGTCKALNDDAKRIESGSDGCSIYERIVPECCPPLTISPTTSSITTPTHVMTSLPSD